MWTWVLYTHYTGMKCTVSHKKPCSVCLHLAVAASCGVPGILRWCSASDVARYCWRFRVEPCVRCHEVHSTFYMYTKANEIIQYTLSSDYMHKNKLLYKINYITTQWHSAVAKLKNNIKTKHRKKQSFLSCKTSNQFKNDKSRKVKKYYEVSHSIYLCKKMQT